MFDVPGETAVAFVVYALAESEGGETVATEVLEDSKLTWVTVPFVGTTFAVKDWVDD